MGCNDFDIPLFSFFFFAESASAGSAVFDGMKRGVRVTEYLHYGSVYPDSSTVVRVRPKDHYRCQHCNQVFLFTISELKEHVAHCQQESRTSKVLQVPARFPVRITWWTLNLVAVAGAFLFPGVSGGRREGIRTLCAPFTSGVNVLPIWICLAGCSGTSVPGNSPTCRGHGALSLPSVSRGVLL